MNRIEQRNRKKEIEAIRRGAVRRRRPPKKKNERVDTTIQLIGAFIFLLCGWIFGIIMYAITGWTYY